MDSPSVTVVNSGLPTLVNSLCLALYCFTTTTQPCTKPERNVFPSLVWKNSTGLHRTSARSNTFGVNWNDGREPVLITQHQLWISLMLLWLNGSKSLQPVQHLVERLKPEEWRLSEQDINEHGFGMCSSITSRFFWPYSVWFLSFISGISAVSQICCMSITRNRN